MPSHLRSQKKILLPIFALAMGGLAGCTFVPSHSVTVDAISGPVTSIGPAYRLVDKDPLAARESGQHKVVFGSVAAALDTKGIFEAPPGVPPDLIIEVDYGASRRMGGARAAGMPATTENFLQLSARRPKPSEASGKGEEIWNVRTTILEDRVDLGTLIPVLAAVTSDYIGLDTQVEKTVRVSEKQANIVHVKSVAQGIARSRSAP